MGNNLTIKDTGIEANLLKFAMESEKAKFKALKKGAEHFAGEVEKATPIGPYRSPTKYGPGTEKYSPVHMKDDVKYQKKGFGYVVGYGSATGWRAGFINNGTVKLAPTFFFDKVVQTQLRGTYDVVEKELRDNLFK